MQGEIILKGAYILKKRIKFDVCMVHDNSNVHVIFLPSPPLHFPD